MGADDPTLDLPDPRSPRHRPSPAPDAAPAAESVPGASAQESNDSPRLGAFTLLRKLGKGGMGVVFEAEQKHPRRRVALKVIRSSLLSPEILRRFEYESQVLARLQHVGIAQIFQAGVVKDRHGHSTPYFAMELVHGQPLTAFAAARNLGTRDRLELVARICDAVAHAHQKGVIHRDLKPANILVDESGQPKILDFGVARTTDSDQQQVTVRTDVGQLVGTVQYMSPEQASGNPDEVDTRSDVYAIGVIAYELIAGHPPYDLRRRMLHDAVRIIREGEPSRLSAVDRTLRGDVETIVATALEKDKTRRYQSAEAMAADLRRFLGDEPIHARHATAWDQLRKFSRRHKGLSAGISLAVLILVSGVVTTSLALGRALSAESDLAGQLRETDLARQTAEGHRQRAEQALEDAEVARIRAEEDRAIAVAAGARAAQAESAAAERAREFEQVADFQASLLRRVQPANAGRLLTNDIETRLRESIDAEGAPEGMRDRAAALAAFRALWSRVNATDVTIAFIDRTMLTHAVRSIEESFGDQPLLAARLQQIVADRYSQFGLFADALPLQQKALETRRRLLGDADGLTRQSSRAMGDLLTALGRGAEAAPYYGEVFERRVPRRGSAVARKLETDGRTDEALERLRGLLARSRVRKPEGSAATVRLLLQIGTLLHEHGRLEEAEPYCREAAEKADRFIGSKDADSIACRSRYGSLLRDMGRLADAEPLLVEARRGSVADLGAQHPGTLEVAIELGLLRRAQGRNAEVIDLLAPIGSAVGAAFTGSAAARAGEYHRCLGGSCAALQRFAAAESSLLQAHALFESMGSQADALDCAQDLADLYRAWGASEPGNGYEAKAAEWQSKVGPREP